MDVCRSFWDQTKNGYDVLTYQLSMLNFQIHRPFSCLHDSWLHCPCIPARRPSVELRTVCFIKSLSCRPRGLLHHADRLPLLRSSVEPVSPGSLADDAHGWLDLLTVPYTDSKAICLQSPWAHRLCVCVFVCAHVCVHLTQSTDFQFPKLSVWRCGVILTPEPPLSRI